MLPVIDSSQRERVMKSTRIKAIVSPKRGRNRRREGLEELSVSMLAGLRYI
ncbi:MAG: hypothetical protein QM811_15595 [Pirellulales bacterium]